jgi:hypothetical protein
VTRQPDHNDGTATATDVRVMVVVERLYGCRCHHPQRKRVIERHGVRNDWQPFGVWSLAKAQAQAKCETVRLNRELREQAAATSTKMTDEEKAETSALSSSSDDEDEDDNDEATDTGSRNSKNTAAVAAKAATASIVKRKPCRTMCMNGKCTWKVRSAYDNIYKEIHGESEDDER